MTPRQLQIRTNRWARKLGLGEWKIKAVFGDPAKIVHAAKDWEVYGCTMPCLKTNGKHGALIIVNEPTDGGDVTQTVIHELLHICLDPTSRMADDALFELGLDRVAGALLKGFK